MTDPLRRFYDLSSDPQVLAMLGERDAAALFQDILAEAGRKGHDPALLRDPKSTIEMLRENATSEAMDGRFAGALREGTLGVLDAAGIPVPDFRVAVIHSLEMSACTRMLNGEHVITVNFALILHSLTWWRALLAFYSNGIGEPFCTCRSNREYAVSMLRIAQAVEAGDIRSLASGAIVGCDCRSSWDSTLSRMTEMSEFFVVLHEVGHLTAGHLAEGAADVAHAHAREYEADRFALDALIAAGLEERDALLAACAFLKLVEVGEYLPSHLPSITHPAARDRIDRLLSPAIERLARLRPRPVVTFIHDLYDHVSGVLTDELPDEIQWRLPASRCGAARWRNLGGSRYAPD